MNLFTTPQIMCLLTFGGVSCVRMEGLRHMDTAFGFFTARTAPGQPSPEDQGPQ